MLNDEITILENKVENFNNIINESKNRNSVNDLLLREVLNDLLGQLEVCIKYVIVPKEYEGIVSAFKYVNNMKKHSLSLFNYTITKKGLCPSNVLVPSDKLVPSEFEIRWNELPLDDEKYKKQFSNYNKYLRNQDLPTSINSIISFLKGFKVENK